MSFLSQLAHHVIDCKSIDYQNVAIIVPNQRAQQGLYLEMSSLLSEPILAPTVLSFDDLIQSLSPLQSIDSSEQLIELFHVYRQCAFCTDDAFVNFMNWAGAFLHDINDIDQYLCDADQIYSNLANIKELDFFGQSNLSNNQRKYLDFYYHLNELYAQFKQHLYAQKKGYKGMIYRDVVEHIGEYAKDFRYRRVIFAGLLSLAPAEQRIARFFREQAAAEFFFDLDHFYYDNEKLGIRRMVDEVKLHVGFEKVEVVGNDYVEKPKEITITGAAQAMGQVYAAVDALRGIPEEQLGRTAVVFADESLMVPFVHAFGHEKCNITMGYPVRHTHAAHLFQSLMNAAQNFRRLNNLEHADADRAGYYYKDVVALLRNPLFAQAWFPTDLDMRNLCGDIVKRNRVFISREELNGMLPTEFPDLSIDGRPLIETLCGFLTAVADRLGDDPENVEREVLRLMNEELRKVAALLENFTDAPLDFRTVNTFVSAQINALGIPFIGNPSQGLQLMGLLETRTLDFDNLVVVSANEGVIPTGRGTDSMLLFELKHHYGLPTYEHADTTYAYHFFRLLQRASRIHLIYDMDTSDSANEESRFVRQLEYEVLRRNLSDRIHIVRRKVAVQPRLTTELRELSIPKTSEILQKLREMPYSATNLSQYINCPLKFYLANIAEIQPSKEIEENVEQKAIGTVVHHVMEDLAKKIMESPERFAEHIETFSRQLEDEDFLQHHFWKVDELKNQDLSHGRPLLAVEVVKRQLRKTFVWLKKEMETPALSIKIIRPELKLEKVLSVGDAQVRLKGYADLVEERGGKTSILDYKTGRIHNLNFTEMNAVFSDPENLQLCQLLMYAYLYWKTQGVDPEKIFCALISTQHIMQGIDPLCSLTQPRADGKRGSQSLDITQHLLEDFEDGLRNLLAELLHPDVDFQQTPEIAHCKWCDYQMVCGRNA